MSRAWLLDLGAGPANEPCAQLGCTPGFAALNRLELGAFEAAIIALNGPPPVGLGFASRANAHDFGTYWTLWIVAEDGAALPAAADSWLDDLVVPLSWISAGLPPPVRYEGARVIEQRPLLDVVTGALRITRPAADGSFFPPENALLHRNLLAAYGDRLTDAGLLDLGPGGN